MSQNHKPVGELRGTLSPPQLLIMFSITGSSMSFRLHCRTGSSGRESYRDFLLCDYSDAILAPDSYACVPSSLHCFEGILCVMQA